MQRIEFEYSLDQQYRIKAAMAPLQLSGEDQEFAFHVIKDAFFLGFSGSEADDELLNEQISIRSNLDKKNQQVR
ncbi:hypothetical protein [Pseudovibrio sp. Alg231-02]|uniref:hypothetical protein n=1 Tax=Pseudovibrio sp. Alg231-02 TaxID=1922223 RepID=UPI000D553A4E|nr:hypothetical protein [Pseudovibrio sp. Alg231-02]